MRSLVLNLRRIVGDPGRELSREADLLALAQRFDRSDDATAHALWANIFGLYPARHLGFVADVDEPPPATASWWRTPVAQVPLSLVERGERQIRGRPSAPEDFTLVKRHRMAQRRAEEERRRLALAELAGHSGGLDGAELSTEARTVLLELHARALAEYAAGTSRPAAAEHIDGGAGVGVRIAPTPGRHTVVAGPDGRLTFRDLSVDIVLVAAPALSERTA